MKMLSLHDLLVIELRDLYHAETQITKALPKMAKAATAPNLKSAFEEHLKQTKGHIERLEKVFDLIGEKAKAKKCEAIEGLIEEGKQLMDENADENVLDAGLIAAAQKVEHYEMASYGCVRTWARQLGHNEAADLLQETLDEEGETDKKLTELAEGMINVEAAATR